VIFDVDGVLVASPHERAWREALDALMQGAWRTLASRTSYRPDAFTTEVYQSRVAGKPRLGGASAVLEYFCISDVLARAREYADAKQRRIDALIQAGEFAPFPDAVAVAVALHAAGYPLAAASSSKNANELMRRIDVRDGADRLGLDAAAIDARRTLLDLFVVNVCGRDVGRGKPDPELFLLAATELGMAVARCIVVEDAPSGIEAATAAGMWSVGIARWQDEALLRQAGADVVVNRLDLQVLLPLLTKAGRGQTPHAGKRAEGAHDG
jgi:beta-phosphoglucomutase-like phosphatase (HAD superfamily)